MTFRIVNSLKLDAFAKWGSVATTTDEVRAAQQTAQALDVACIAVGQGTNIIPQSLVNAYVCQIGLTGIEILEETKHEVRLRVAAGESWHELVTWTLSQGYFGLENLALIPGCVGAAPVQNIGAYGVEVEEYVEAVHSFLGGEPVTLSNEECGFRYRESVFKGAAYLITAIDLRLSKVPRIRTEYAGIQDELSRLGVDEPTPKDVYNAVISIRANKLPDPQRVPNAGSFFKNPVVSIEQAQALQDRYPDLNQFPADGGVKLSAAQLIDWAGWKRAQAGHIRCWDKQPLVLVNNGASAASEVLAFAERIREDIFERFQVELEREPTVLG